MKPHIRGGKVLLIGGRIALVGCPEDCCGSPEFPPWPPPDRPPWFDGNRPPAPVAGACATGCLQCSCTPPCRARQDGLHIACCAPDPNNGLVRVVSRYSGNARGRLDRIDITNSRRSQEVVTSIDRTTTWEIDQFGNPVLIGTTGSLRYIEFSDGVLLQDTTSDPGNEPYPDCPITPEPFFTGFGVGAIPPGKCYGLRTIELSDGIAPQSTRVESTTIYSDCRRGYLTQNAVFRSNDSEQVVTTGEISVYRQVTYTPDPCQTPRLCDPNANGGFIP